MKKFYKSAYGTGRKYEMLSAYLDNELSDAEIKKLEDELKFSKELQEKLAELKRLKQLTVSSIKPIEENPFFETKLAATMRTEKPVWVKMRKFMPVTGIVAASLLLMVILKYNPQIIDRVVEQQKSNITAFYKENLKPLLYTANLSNDDIFNFAFYHQLPLNNKKDQVLQLGSDQKGNQFFEIKKAGLVSGQSNLEKFAKALNLNDMQKMEIDSILQSYANGLQAQVLVNEKNTVAINPNIWNFNKAIAANLIAFAAKVNRQKVARVVPPGFDNYYQNGQLAKAVSEAKVSNSNKYIFLTPDSIFSDSFSFDKDKFSKEMKIWNEELNKNMKEMSKQLSDMNITVNFSRDFSHLKNDSARDKDFRVFVDSNGCRVHLSKLMIPPVHIPNIDSILSNINSATGLFKSFSFKMPEHNGKNYNYKYFYSDSSKNHRMNFKFYSFDSTYTFGNKKADSAFINKFKNFRSMNPDSMASMFRFFYNDSSSFQQKELRKQMQEFQKEMENFRKEMEQWQKQFQKNIPKGQKAKSPVEI